MTYQTIIIAGNLGSDPTLRYTDGGKAVVSFSVAVSNYNKTTTWFRVTAWEKLAETCNTYLKKGAKVLAQGRLESDPATGGPKMWTAKDGTQKASFDLTANTVRFLSGSRDGAEVAPEGDDPF